MILPAWFEWLWPALLAGSIFALVAGPYGSLLVWRGMSFFADSLAHGSLLGIALALFLQISPWYGLFFCAVLFVTLLHFFQRSRTLSNDALLGIISQSSLAFALLFIYWIKPQGLRIEQFLLGDLLAVQTSDLVFIFAAATLALISCLLCWPSWVLNAIDSDLAKSELRHYQRKQWIFLISLALLVAVAIPLIGALLVGALFILPTTTARQFSHSPTTTAWYSSLIALLSVWLGIAISWQVDLPAGPAIVCAASGLFFISQLIGKRASFFGRK